MKKMSHIPVLLNETIDHLGVRSVGHYVDATLGGGGHTRALLAAAAPAGKVLALDRDRTSVLAMQQRTDIDQTRLELAHASYEELPACLAELGWPPVNGIVADLGFSSLQLDDPARGFSYRFDAELDLRFDQSAGVPAWQMLARLRPQELGRILAEYGELAAPYALAQRIIDHSTHKPIRTTSDLLEASGLKHPARQAQLFQAIRIAVNDEFGTLRRSLPKFWKVLAPGGRLAVISFHSAEDRIVKHFYQEKSRLGQGTILTKKAIKPTADEMATNPRSRSAQLRVIEKIGE